MNASGENNPVSTQPPVPPPGQKNDILGGVILISLGVLFLARNLIPWFDFSDYWPVFLIIIGIALILRSRR